MILVDTSVWIDHFRRSDALLDSLLDQRQALAHPFVTGELALGTLRQRDVILSTLQSLPQAAVGTSDEVLGLIVGERLAGSGIGYVDAHLLAAARLTPAPLWTRDKRLLAIAVRLRLAAKLFR